MSLLENTKHDIYPFISPTSGLASAFAGKAILITGAGTGIGRATALTFAHAGASRIIVAGRRLAPLEECKAAIEKAAKGCEVTVAADTDVADEGAVKRLFEKAGSVDVLVNNAATVGVRGLDSEEVGLWWQEIEVNLRGVFLCSNAFFRSLAGRPGRIVNVTSVAAAATMPGLSSYSTSKVALNKLTENLEFEFGPHGVHCIAFHPGGIAGTEMGAKAPDWLKPLLIDTVELAAGTCAYLATDRSAFLGGRFVSATWDMEEVERHQEQIVKEDLFKTRITGYQYGSIGSSE